MLPRKNVVEFKEEIVSLLEAIDKSGSVNPNKTAIIRLLSIYTEIKGEKVSMCCDAKKVYRYFKSEELKWRSKKK